MQIRIELTHEKIVRPQLDTADGSVGAWVEFSGVVRGEEGGKPIAALEYEAYDSMAERVVRMRSGRIIEVRENDTPKEPASIAW